MQVIWIQLSLYMVYRCECQLQYPGWSCSQLARLSPSLETRSIQTILVPVATVYMPYRGLWYAASGFLSHHSSSSGSIRYFMLAAACRTFIDSLVALTLTGTHNPGAKKKNKKKTRGKRDT